MHKKIHKNLLARLCLGGPYTNQAKYALGNFVMSGSTIINSPLQIAFIVKNKHFGQINTNCH